MTTRTVPRFTLADRLTKARSIAGLTQQQLADALGISRKSVVRYETDADPRFDMVSRWADACGVDAVWLMVGEDADAITRAINRQEARDPYDFSDSEIAGQYSLFTIDYQVAA